MSYTTMANPMPLSQLISSLLIHPSKTSCIYRLMRIMVHSGFFSQKNVTENELEGEYVLTDASILLLKNHHLSLTLFLNTMLDQIITNPSQQLSTWFKNDDLTPYKTTHGMYIWDHGKSDSDFNQLFNEGMASDARFVHSVVIEKCKEVFAGFESLVDVGGGTGTIAKAIAKEFPQMECVVFDLPHVVADLQGSENLKYVGGDMFQEIPSADVILLKWMMHDWNDDECINILKRCKEAIISKGKEGKVIIIDIVINNEEGDNESIETQLLCDIMLVVLYNRKERNKKEWDKLITFAGFSNYKITPVLGIRSVIEIHP